jgi:hypothetical protein
MTSRSEHADSSVVGIRPVSESVKSVIFYLHHTHAPTTFLARVFAIATEGMEANERERLEIMEIENH